MIGVIVVPGHSSKMHGLDAKRSLALLPLGDRPILQHIVESLVAQGITSIELIVDHAPESIEALLGNGDRWGCKFRYHLASHGDRRYRSLKIISELRSEPWILIHAESYPYIEFQFDSLEKPIVFYGPSSDNLNENSHSDIHVWKGSAIFPAGAPSETFVNQTVEQLHAQMASMASTSEVVVVGVPAWLDASSPAALLRSQTMLLERQLPGLMISGMEREPGIWISRNVVIHPSVELTAPLYVGPNSRLNRGVRLGPNAVIEGECIVDTNTTIENSIVTSGTYIGEGLELNQSLVDHNLLINARLGTSVNVVESFLLGGLKRQRKQSWFVRLIQSIAALALMLLFSPIFLLAVIYYSLVKKIEVATTRVVRLPAKSDELQSCSYDLPCIGKDAWSVSRKAGWTAFTRQFLPGLLAVVGGHISMVGLPPRSTEEILALSEEWRRLYLDGVAGLINEAALSLSEPEDGTQRYLADAYYVVRRSSLYNLKLAVKYFVRLFLPA